jgi:hypothetical protein
MKVHLLYRDRDFNFLGGSVPLEEALVQDLELGVVFGVMAQGDQFLDDVARQVVLRGVSDPDDVRYRQDVLKDFITQPELAKELYAACVQLIKDRKESWGIWGRSSNNPSTILSGSVRELELYVAVLKRLRGAVDLYADSVQSEGLKNFFVSLQENLTEEYFATLEEHLRHLRFHNGIVMSAVLGPDNAGREFVLRSPHSTRATWKQRLGFEARSSYSFTIPSRDEAAAQSLENLRSRGVNLVANAVAQSADHVQNYFAALRAEVAFYIGCLNVHNVLSERTVPLCFPDPAAKGAGQLHALNLRDISLCLHSDGPVVGNDLHADGKSLVIVTGANSGGKSTFLRSLGLAQLFMQCGSFVAAESFGASLSGGEYTHFIREEDTSMTRGRLDDELARMSEIVKSISLGSLLLCNESFASTNEREGSEIGRQVVQALLDCGVRVVYVTHQYDFAESFVHSGATENVLFLRAERDADGSRSFKITEHDPQPTSYGADLYAKVFAAE